MVTEIDGIEYQERLAIMIYDGGLTEFEAMNRLKECRGGNLPPAEPPRPNTTEGNLSTAQGELFESPEISTFRSRMREMWPDY